MKTALVTGATSGFGKAFALRLAQLNYRIIITGRRNDRLLAVESEIKNLYHVEVLPLCFDIRSKASCEKAIQSLPKAFSTIDLLVNNAGLAAGASPFQDSDIDDFERMLDTNVKGLIYITKLIVPGMINRKAGHIVNISSIAGLEVYSNGSVYCASKHAVKALTQGLRLDLLQYGIKVSSISPGMVETEFATVRYHGDTEKAKAVYAGIVPLNADDIADVLEFIVTRPDHVMINDVHINPKQQATTFLTHRIF
jgi:3-hydroxy acid dehydrogenase / malonic semialdehyde reductase